MRIRRILGKFLLLVASVLVSCLLLEVGVRLFLGDDIVLYPRFHARAEYGEYTIRRLRPNARFRHRSMDGSWEFTINAQGFRAARDYSYDKPDGVLRVICVGDSQTEGFECRQDKTYAAVMERYFETHGQAAEVINAGVSGFSTAEALVFIDKEGMRYDPDAVVLGFFANDLDDNIKAGLFKMGEEGLVENRYEHIPGVNILDTIDRLPPLPWLSQNSYAYSSLFNTVWDIMKRRLLKKSESAMATEFAIKQEDVSEEVKRRKHLLGTALIERLYAVCRSNDVALVILDVPQLPEKRGLPTRSSIPADLLGSFAENSDMLIVSTDALADYEGVIDVFVPHGQRHISETTHMLLGVLTAKSILEYQSHLSSAGGMSDEAGELEKEF